MVFARPVPFNAAHIPVFAIFAAGLGDAGFGIDAATTLEETLRRTFTIIALLTFAIYANGIVAIWSCYYASADAIAAAYCVNPSKPCCHGKCYIGRLAVNQQSGNTPASAISTLKLSPYVAATEEALPAATPIPPAYHSPEEHARDGSRRAIDHPPPYLA